MKKSTRFIVAFGLILAVACFSIVVFLIVSENSTDSRSEKFNFEEWTARFDSQNEVLTRLFNEHNPDVSSRFRPDMNYRERFQAAWPDNRLLHSHVLEHGFDFMNGRSLEEFPELLAVADEPVDVSTFSDWDEEGLRHRIWPHDKEIVVWMKRNLAEFGSETNFFLFFADPAGWTSDLASESLEDSDLLLLAVSSQKIVAYQFFSEFETTSQLEKRIAVITENFDHGDLQMQLAAVESIGREREFIKAIPVLNEALSSNSETLCQAAIRKLTRFIGYGPADQSKVPELEITLKPLVEVISGGFSDSTRQSAAKLACDIAANLGDPTASNLLSVLEAASGDSPDEFALGAMRTIRETPDRNAPSVPAIAKQSLTPAELLSPLEHSKNLRSLNLSGISVDLHLFESMPSVLLVEELTLAEDTTDEDLGQLHYFKSVRKLNLTQCGKISDAGLDHLARLPNLKEIYASSVIGDAGVEILVNHHPDLEILSLWGSRVTSASEDNLVKLKKLRFLSVYMTPLNGRYPSISKSTRRIIQALPACEVEWID